MAVDRTRERGESKGFSGIISLAVFAAFCLAMWNVAPPYMADYSLGDKIRELCRLNKALNPDEEIREKLMKVVREERLEEFVNKPMFVITTRENSRRIVLEYQREIQILPGWKRVFKFSHNVDQPFF